MDHYLGNVKKSLKQLRHEALADLAEIKEDFKTGIRPMSFNPRIKKAFKDMIKYISVCIVDPRYDSKRYYNDKIFYKNLIDNWARHVKKIDRQPFKEKGEDEAWSERLKKASSEPLTPAEIKEWEAYEDWDLFVQEGYKLLELFKRVFELFPKYLYFIKDENAIAMAKRKKGKTSEKQGKKRPHDDEEDEGEDEGDEYETDEDDDDLYLPTKKPRGGRRIRRIRKR